MLLWLPALVVVVVWLAGGPIWLMVMGGFAAAVVAIRSGRQSAAGGPAPRGAAPKGRSRLAVEEVRLEASGISMFDVPRLMDAGRWDEARRAMQKLAYGMPGESDQVRAQFTELMKSFAVRDPLFRLAIQVCEAVIARSPGMRQTAMYAELPDLSTEEVRYVLYFGEQLGRIQRRKRGNSYELFPSGQPLPELIEKPKRERKTRPS